MNSSQKILDQFRNLNGDEQERVLSTLRLEFDSHGQSLQNAMTDLKAQSIKKSCPHCKSSHTHKRGLQKGVQMYKCVSCEKWFSSTTGTPLWDIKKKEKWQSYIACMQQGMSIKKTAKAVGISIQTSFDWRHKILSVLSGQAPEKLEGTVECDELELALSNKGDRNLQRKPRHRGTDFKRNTKTKEVTTVQVITAVDRNGKKYLKAVETKRISAKQIKEAIGQKLGKRVTLITDEHPSYKPFVKTRKGIKHKTVKASEHVNRKDNKINLQRVNQTHKQLRGFLVRFNGVSSKYLQNYLDWFAYGKNMEEAANQIKQWFYVILTSEIAYNAYQLTKLNAVNIRT